MNKTTKIIGSLLLILLATGVVYVALIGENVKLRVDNDKSTFYVLENSRWLVSGREYNSIFDGTSKMNRVVSNIRVDTIVDETNSHVTIIRTTPYIRGPVIIDTYYFDGKLDDVEMFPISHTVEIINGSGYFYRYEVRDLEYDGITYKLAGETDLSFGKNMKVELHPNYRWAWVYKDGIAKAQYDILTDYEVFDIRLFDPKVSKIVWKNNNILFCEGKHKGKDKLTKPQTKFIEGALSCGIPEKSLMIVEWEYKK